MNAVLEVVGLIALVVAGFLLALWLGFAVLGGGCLWVSYSSVQKQRSVSKPVRRADGRLVNVA